MTETTVPLLKAARMGAEAKSRFPSDSNEDKERRALKAALNVADLRDEFSSVTAARAHLEGLFAISERQIRRVEKILRYPEIVQLVLKGPCSITNASHVIEHAGIDMLRIAWACAPEKARQEFRQLIDRAGRPL